MTTVVATKFEQRMLKLKGVRLPAMAMQAPTFNTGGRPPQLVPNSLCSTLNVSVESMYNKDTTSVDYATDDDSDEVNEEEMYTVSNSLDDIVTGVVRSFDTADTHRGQKINKAVVISILDRMPTISAQAIMDNYGYSRSQAGHYLQACRVIVMLCKRQEHMCAWSHLIINAE